MAAEAIQRWHVGDVRISKVVEHEIDGFLEAFIPAATKQALEQIPWLKPHFLSKEGLMTCSLHSLVIETDTRRILVDTCVGNDKPRPAVPAWNNRQSPFLETLAEAGYPRESIDTVLSTHLHVDHVGWNTMQQDGRWLPTFPNARYVMNRAEFEHWRELAREAQPNEDWAVTLQRQVFSDSVQPVSDAGLIDLVDAEHQICEEVSLFPTHGHTPGHVSVKISSRGREALITGDIIHHPCQIAHPSWGANVDSDEERSAEARRRVLSEVADTETLVIGTHWTAPTAGRVVRDGSAFRLDFDL